MIKLSKLKGALKRHVTEEEIHEVREQVLQELLKKKGLK